MFAPGSPVRDRDFRVGSQCPVLVISHLSPAFNVLVQVFELYFQNGSLKGVEAAVTAYHIMIISFALAMIGYHFQLVSQSIIIGHNSAAIAVSAEVFRRE